MMNPKTYTRFVLYVALLLNCTLLTGQQDYARDTLFFKRQAQQYQRWLDTLGLGTSLQVEQVRFQTDRSTGLPITSELELLLALQSPDPDTAAALWNNLQRAYSLENNGSLLNELFRSFVHFMDISPLQGNVQIYAQQSSGKRSPCYFVWVWEDANGIQDSLMRNGCKAQSFDIFIPAITVQKSSQKNRNTTTIPRVLTANEAFDQVMKFAHLEFPYNKYDGTNCSGRHPAVEEEGRTDTELRFTVTELCREALTNGQLSLWCQCARKTGWQRDCNDIRRERLEFTFVYAASPKPTHGFTLKCTLRGKFGASDYVPRSTDYYDLDPEFIAFEKEYADKFQRKLTQFLLKKP
jgi:hypothetical protein